MAYQDLLKDTSQVAPDDNNKFIVTITDLDVNASYPIQFRWKYSDGTFGVWSTSKILTTPGESTPGTPNLAVGDVVGGAGFLTVTWDGKDTTGATMTNIDRVDIYIDNPPFDGSKPTDNFKTAGTKTFATSAGTYLVTLRAVSALNTVSGSSSTRTAIVTSSVVPVDPPETPSTPTVTSVLGAIQLAWNGKTSDGSDQPSGFTAAKVYVGTSAGFTPSSTNQVDTLNFANGQNTLNIGVGTVVNGTALTYNTNYYVKIATTNGTADSTPVSATGNPVQIGKVSAGDIVSVVADQITTGTLSSSSTITVGSPTGKHITLAGTGNPLTIYDTDGTTELLSYGTNKLTIVGDGSFSGDLSIGSSNAIFKAEPATGIWLGNAAYVSAPFSVSVNGYLKAASGTVGGWNLTNSALTNTAQTFDLNSSTSTIRIGPYSSGDHIRISASGGITHANSSGVSTGKFTLSPNGNLTISGEITASSGYIGSGDNRWMIDTNGITSTGVGNITMGNYTMYNDGYGYFKFSESGYNIIETFGSNDGINGRIYLGHASRRQIEVRKPAQFQGVGTRNSDPGDSSPDGAAYRSGGLRNMYTVSSGSVNLQSDIYPSAANGDVLLVYDADTGI
jgi:hypothetical protein